MGSSYSSYYVPSTRKLTEEVKAIEKAVERIVTKVVAVPFTIHGVSKLTKDSEGLKIWLSICTFVNELTNKVVQHKAEVRDKDGNLVPYKITDRCFYVPEGDVEAIVHDMCHWIIASKTERTVENLSMDGMNEADLIYREELAWSLEAWIFSAVMGEPDLVDHVSPHAEIETFHYWVRAYDPILITLEALQKASEVGLNVTLLRRLLASWAQWRELHPAKDARPRGCLGWGSIGLSLPIRDKLPDPSLQQTDMNISPQGGRYANRSQTKEWININFEEDDDRQKAN